MAPKGVRQPDRGTLRRSIVARIVSRRRGIAVRFARAGAGALIGAFATARSQPATVFGSAAAPVLPSVEVPQPNVLRSTNGELALTLTARPAVVEMGAGHPIRTYTYDGVVPGYTWEINPGDTMRIDLVNDLPPLPHTGPVDLTRPHEWTHTNLHTHGLHVSPPATRTTSFLTFLLGALSTSRFRCQTIIPQDSSGTTPIGTAPSHSKSGPAWRERSSCAARSMTWRRCAPPRSRC